MNKVKKRDFLNGEQSLPDDPIKNFLETKEYSSVTKRNYTSTIRNFLDFILREEKRDKALKGSLYFEKKQEEWEEWDSLYPKLAREYLQTVLEYRKEQEEEAAEANYYVDPREETGDLIFEHLKRWLGDMKEDGMAQSTINQNLSSVKQFLLFYRRVIKFTLLDSDFKALSDIAGSREPVTQDRKPTKSDLRKIISNTGIEGKALFLCLAASGMRLGELLKLKKDQVDLSGEVGTICIPKDVAEKHKSKRWTFLTSEAKDALQNWLEYREKHYNKRGPKPGKDFDEDRLFPILSSTAMNMWNGACKKAGVQERDKDTNRRMLHIHTLRKFFRTELGKRLPIDVVEALMGHKTYLSDSYRRYMENESDRKELREMYRKAQDSLTLSKPVEDVKEIEDTVSQLKERLDERNGKIEELRRELEQEKGKRKQLKEELKKELVDPDLVKDIIREEIRKQLKEEENSN